MKTVVKISETANEQYRKKYINGCEENKLEFNSYMYISYYVDFFPSFHHNEFI